MNVDIIYQDRDIAVVNKPFGVTVNRSETTKEDTLQDWVKTHIELKKGSFDTDFYKRSGIVHRLDKETSGVLVIAKTDAAFKNLQEQFKKRLVSKTYLALVHGKVEEKQGIIRLPVGRLPWNRMRFGVIAGGREAETAYQVLSIKHSFSYLKLLPKTGRTHQIRIHVKHIGHPIFSDALYAGRKTARSDRKLLPRLFLHASSLSFLHPRTGKQITFESKLPNELQQFLLHLKE